MTPFFHRVGIVLYVSAIGALVGSDRVLRRTGICAHERCYLILFAFDPYNIVVKNWMFAVADIKEALLHFRCAFGALFC